MWRRLERYFVSVKCDVEWTDVVSVKFDVDLTDAVSAKCDVNWTDSVTAKCETNVLSRRRKCQGFVLWRHTNDMMERSEKST